jgi:hypothetical protein
MLQRKRKARKISIGILILSSALGLGAITGSLLMAAEVGLFFVAYAAYCLLSIPMLAYLYRRNATPRYQASTRFAEGSPSLAMILWILGKALALAGAVLSLMGLVFLIPALLIETWYLKLLAVPFDLFVLACSIALLKAGGIPGWVRQLEKTSRGQADPSPQ